MPKVIKASEDKQPEKGPEVEEVEEATKEAPEDEEVAKEESEEEPTEEDKAKLFVKEYNELCSKYGFEVGAAPKWKISEDGSWNLVIDVRLTRLQEQE